MEDRILGSYYYRINDRLNKIEKVKETNSTINNHDYELGNYYKSYGDAEDVLNNY